MSLDEPDVLVGARRECPLVVGRGEGEQFIASAVPAFLAQTRARPVRGERRDRRAAPRRASRSRPPPASRWSAPQVTVDWDEETAEKGGFETFMLKEIHEQADAVAETIADRTARGDGVDLDEEGALDEALLAGVERIVDRRLRDLLPRRPDRALRDRGVGAGARSRWTSPPSTATATPSSARATS